MPTFTFKLSVCHLFSELLQKNTIFNSKIIELSSWIMLPNNSEVVSMQKRKNKQPAGRGQGSLLGVISK